LLSSSQAEAAARDALYASTRFVPTNERDHSWLRAGLESVRGELDPFLRYLQSDPIGRATHEEWQEWLGTCRCVWNEAQHDETVEYFPTARFHAGIGSDCRMHQTIEACNAYCTVIEQEWLRVADWYQGEQLRPGGGERSPGRTSRSTSDTR
jgi:hypothetical protein